MGPPKRIDYVETSGFRNDLRRLLKRFRTLEDDLGIAKVAAIELYHLNDIDNHSVEEIPGFCTAETRICKLKKFTCKSLPNRGCRSGIRIIYAYRTPGPRVDFIQIYFKGDQPCEDRDRIAQYLATVSDQ